MGYRAKSRDDKINDNNNDNSFKSNLAPLKDELKQKAGEKALEAMGVPKGLSKAAMNLAKNNNIGKRNPMMPNMNLGKKINSSEKNNQSSKDNKSTKDDLSQKNNSNEQKLDKNSKPQISKDNYTNKNNSELVAIKSKFYIASSIAIPVFVIIFIIFIIFISLYVCESVFGAYIPVDNLYLVEQQTNNQNENTNISDSVQQDYYAPIQGVSGINYVGMGSTAGCLNNVYHDINNISEGTKIYAGQDGTAEFIQISCNGVLYSYGNQVRITSSNGTSIIYGHLNSFSSDINAPITKTCPKKGSSQPCPASTCSGGLKRNVIKTKQVKKGEEIGTLGNTGNSTGAHLHVEIHPAGGRSCVVDPWKSFGMR